MQKPSGHSRFSIFNREDVFGVGKKRQKKIDELHKILGRKGFNTRRRRETSKLALVG